MRAVSDRRIIARSRLFDKVFALEPRLVSIIAPAGYGKTTLARQLVASFESSAICDCLDIIDAGDLARRLLRALAPYNVERAAGWALEQVAAIGNADDWEELAVSAWSNADAPAVVIFDNAEWLASLARFSTLLRRLINSHSRTIVICSRRSIAIPFGHGIEPDDVSLIQSSDLAFTRDEARIVLNAPADGSLDEAMALTGGWPLAIGMIARMSQHEDLTAVLQRASIQCTDELNEYLVTQFVADLAPDTLEILVAISALPQATIADVAAALGHISSETIVAACKSLPVVVTGELVSVHPLVRSTLYERFAHRINQIVRDAIVVAHSASDHTRVAELYLALGEQRAAAAALEDVGPYMISTPSLRVSTILASLTPDVLIAFPKLWCAAVIHRGYAMPPEEWLSTALGIWSRLDSATESTVRTSVASCVLNGYTNIGKCADAARFLAAFEQVSEPNNSEVQTLLDIWQAALHSFAGRYSQLDRFTERLAPLFAVSHVSHALYLYEVLAPAHRARGERHLEHLALERAIELGAGSPISVFTIIRVEAAFGAWFAGEDDEFARHLSDLEASVTPSVARGHRFFLACAHGRGSQTKPGYEKMRARAEALLIATSLARSLPEARELIKRAVIAADLSERPFFRAITRIAWAELDADNAVALRKEANDIARAVEASAFRAALAAVVSDGADTGMLAPFIARFATFADRKQRIELRLLDAVVMADNKPIVLAEREYGVLAQLAAEDRWHSGAELADALFSELDEATAHTRVYVYLHRLRKRFADIPIVQTAREGYRLASTVSVDFWKLDHLLSFASTSGWDSLSPTDREWLHHVALQPRATKAITREVEQKLRTSKDRLRIELARQLQAACQWAECLVLCRAMLQDDSCDEAAHELAIRTLLAADNRPAALAQWAEYCANLQAELGVGPNPQLRALLEHEDNPSSAIRSYSRVIGSAPAPLPRSV